MRSSQISLLAALVAPLAFAQNLSGLPACASGPAFAALSSSGCTNITDIACICKATAFLNSLIPAIQQSCTNQSDLQAAGQFAVALCAGAGVTITLPALFSTPAGTPATAPATTPATAPATTPAAAPTTPAATTPTASATATPATSAAPSSLSAASYSSTSVPSSSPSATSAVAPVSEYTDGQPQATSIVAPVSEFTDGQPQAPTAAPNATTTYAAPTVSPFHGAAASYGVQLLTMTMLVGTISAFLAL